MATPARNSTASGSAWCATAQPTPFTAVSRAHRPASDRGSRSRRGFDSLQRSYSSIAPSVKSSRSATSSQLGAQPSCRPLASVLSKPWRCVELSGAKNSGRCSRNAHYQHVLFPSRTVLRVGHPNRPGQKTSKAGSDQSSFELCFDCGGSGDLRCSWAASAAEATSASSGAGAVRLCPSIHLPTF